MKLSGDTVEQMLSFFSFYSLTYKNPRRLTQGEERILQKEISSSSTFFFPCDNRRRFPPFLISKNCFLLTLSEFSVVSKDFEVQLYNKTQQFLFKGMFECFFNETGRMRREEEESSSRHKKTFKTIQVVLLV